MQQFKSLTTIIILLLCMQSAFAQGKYTTTNQKAIKLFDKAMESFQAKDMLSCESNLLKAIKEDEQFLEAHMLLGNIYDEQKLT
ncbi:MAG TPA: hypothetical protein PLI16_08490, partial [Bacteroidales bacterium]|nr:hypothetical protein [Bacteroidales bacterium]